MACKGQGFEPPMLHTYGKRLNLMLSRVWALFIMDTVRLYKNETGFLLTVFVKSEKRRKK